MKKFFVLFLFMLLSFVFTLCPVFSTPAWEVPPSRYSLGGIASWTQENYQTIIASGTVLPTTGDPSETPEGYLFLLSSTTADTGLYRCESQVWNLVAGGSSSSGGTVDTATITTAIDENVASITALEASTFSDFSDTPATYTGNAGKTVVVNSGETALEYVRDPVNTTSLHRTLDFPLRNDIANHWGFMDTSGVASMSSFVELISIGDGRLLGLIKAYSLIDPDGGFSAVSLVYSNDNGVSWAASSDSLMLYTRQIHATDLEFIGNDIVLAVEYTTSYTDPNTFVVTPASSGRILRSTDAGDSWAVAATATGTDHFKQISYCSNGRVVASTWPTTNSLWRSYDDGETWASSDVAGKVYSK